MKARTGTTLVEVLIAIFIMAIGLLALMTLFPLGALSMATAIRDDRVSQAAQQGTAIANAQNVRIDPLVTPSFTTSGLPTAANTLAATWDGPSYPVFADPWGVIIGQPTTLAGSRVKRTSLSIVTASPMPYPAPSNPFNSQLYYAGCWCSLQDELSFTPAGVPETLSSVPATGGSFDRNPQTTWAYWLRRPNQLTPNVVELTVVVYSGRNLLSASPEAVLTNTSYPANPTLATVSAPPIGTAGTTTPNVLNINVASTPDIRKGQWIVDVTFHNTAGNKNQMELAKQWGPIQGNWYRVTNLVNTNTGISLDLQPTPPVAIQQFVVMDGVIDVFAKGTGWK